MLYCISPLPISIVCLWLSATSTPTSCYWLPRGFGGQSEADFADWPVRAERAATITKVLCCYRKHFCKQQLPFVLGEQKSDRFYKTALNARKAGKWELLSTPHLRTWLLERELVIKWGVPVYKERITHNEYLKRNQTVCGDWWSISDISHEN